MVASGSRSVTDETYDDQPNSEGVAYLTRDEARATFDRTARDRAGVSGEEFIRRSDAGEYDSLQKFDPIRYGRLSRLAFLSPLARG